MNKRQRRDYIRLNQPEQRLLQAHEFAGHDVSDVYFPLRPSPDERPRILRQIQGIAKVRIHKRVKALRRSHGFFFDGITDSFQPESNGAPIFSSTACATL